MCSLFFREVIDKVVTERNAKVLVTDSWKDGPHPVYEIEYRDQRLAFFHPGVGAPLAAGLLAHENLLKLVRLHEGSTDHWPTPSRALEKDLSAAAYHRYLACTAGAESRALYAAYRESWKWSLELFKSVAEPLHIELPTTAIKQVQRLLNDSEAPHNDGIQRTSR